jgi:hypothetical protein
VSSASEIEAIFRDAFEDVALLIGGTPSLHGREDQVVRTPMRRLGGVRSRVLSGSGGRLRADARCEQDISYLSGGRQQSDRISPDFQPAARPAPQPLFSTFFRHLTPEPASSPVGAYSRSQ